MTARLWVQVGKALVSVCAGGRVEKNPMSVCARRGLGKPPCLCEQEGPHIYVYKDGIEKTLMFVCAGRG